MKVKEFVVQLLSMDQEREIVHGAWIYDELCFSSDINILECVLNDEEIHLQEDIDDEEVELDISKYTPAYVLLA